MSSLTLQVECMAGTDLRTCIEDALCLLKKLDIGYVKFKFNGTEVCIGKGCAVDLAVTEWQEKTTKKFFIFH